MQQSEQESSQIARQQRCDHPTAQLINEIAKIEWVPSIDSNRSSIAQTQQQAPQVAWQDKREPQQSSKDCVSVQHLTAEAVGIQEDSSLPTALNASRSRVSLWIFQSTFGYLWPYSVENKNKEFCSTTVASSTASPRTRSIKKKGHHRKEGPITHRKEAHFPKKIGATRHDLVHSTASRCHCCYCCCYYHHWLLPLTLRVQCKRHWVDPVRVHKQWLALSLSGVQCWYPKAKCNFKLKSHFNERKQECNCATTRSFDYLVHAKLEWQTRN